MCANKELRPLFLEHRHSETKCQHSHVPHDRIFAHKWDLLPRIYRGHSNATPPTAIATPAASQVFWIFRHEAAPDGVAVAAEAISLCQRRCLQIRLEQTANLKPWKQSWRSPHLSLRTSQRLRMRIPLLKKPTWRPRPMMQRLWLRCLGYPLHRQASSLPRQL